MIKWTLFLILVSFSSFAWGQQKIETIHYKIMQMGLKAGDATLSFHGVTQYKGRDVVYIDFLADGMNFLDHEKIYLDATSLKPAFVERDLNIFGKKEKILEEYTHNQLKITKTVGSKTSQQVIDKAGWMDNIYAFIYRYRKTGKFEINESFDINLPTKDIKIILLRQETMKLAGQAYDVLYMQSDPSKYKIWFDASLDKLPLRISGAIGIANTAMVMSSYEKK